SSPYYDITFVKGDLTVTKATVTAPSATNYTYDGNWKTGVPESDWYTVTGNVEKEAGTYTATVTLLDSYNYKWDDSTSASKNLTWSIGKATYDMTKAHWSTPRTFIYDGNEKFVEVLGLPAGVDVKVYVDDKATVVGKYTAKAELTYDTKNYYQPTIANCEWEIKKLVIPVPEAETGLTYTGELLTGVPDGMRYNISANKKTDAGNYTAVAVLKDKQNYIWETGDYEDKSIPWSIAVVEVPIPSANTGLVYTGDLKVGVVEGDYYEVEEGSATDAGNYTAVVKLKDKKNYVWKESTQSTDDKEIEWFIAKAEVPIPQAKTGLTFTNEDQIGVPEGLYYTLSEDVVKRNAGNYSAHAVLDDDANYMWADKTSEAKDIPWSIAKVVVTVPESTDHTYDGTTKTGVPTGDYYTITGNTGVNAGTYHAKATLVNTTNYKWSDETEGATPSAERNLDWNIAKANFDMDGVVWSDPKTFKYDGHEHGVTLIGLPAGLSATYLRNTATEAGEYKAEAVFSYNTTNYNAPSVPDCTWSITRTKTIVDDPSATSYVYNGDTRVGIAPNEYYTVTNGSGINVGIYNVTVTLRDTANCTWKDGSTDPKSLTWEITKATVDVPKAVTGLKYNGNDQIGVPAGLKYSIVNNVKSAANSYQATATLLDPTNYMWVGGSSDPKLIDWSIEKATFDMKNAKWSEPTTFMYDGNQHGVTLVGLPSGLTVTYSNNTAVNAGNYIAKAVFGYDKNNYYEPSVSDCPWSITKEKTKVKVPAGPSIMYTGEEQIALSDTNYYTVTNGKGTAVGTYQATVSLKDPAKYEWADETTDDKIVTWYITKALVDIPSSAVGLVYEKNVTQTGVPSGDGYSLTGISQATNAGTYQAKAILTDKANYEWADHTTTDKEYTWSIAKAPVTVPTGKTGLVYNKNPQTGVEAVGDLYTIGGTYQATNAGNYNATAILNDKDNYMWAGKDSENQTVPWSIAKADYEFTPVWSDPKTFVYNSGPQGVTIVSGLPSGVEVSSYSENSKTNVGTYTATATLSYDTVNYNA
ncbi:MAG: hypothetical protein MJZ68_08995, partial [archaeon]|nr:hypothetical protein [archaeon]